MKIAFIINGKGGVGKDSFCDSVAKKFKVKNISSVSFVKDILKQVGWQGTKTDKDRKAMADLKALFTEYNDYPTTYCYNEYLKFLTSDEQIMFIHIREPQEINKLVLKAKADGNTIYTLLVRRPEAEKVFGNSSDDNVFYYNYDYIFNNTCLLDELDVKAVEFINKLLNNNNLAYNADQFN